MYYTCYMPARSPLPLARMLPFPATKHSEPSISGDRPGLIVRDKTIAYAPTSSSTSNRSKPTGSAKSSGIHPTCEGFSGSKSGRLIRTSAPLDRDDGYVLLMTVATAQESVIRNHSHDYRNIPRILTQTNPCAVPKLFAPEAAQGCYDSPRSNLANDHQTWALRRID